MIGELVELKERIPHAHWEQIVEKIRSIVLSDFASEPPLLQNPKPLLSSKGRPTKRQARTRAIAKLPTGLQKSSSSTKRTPSSWETYEKKARKCRLCGQVNASHDSRNCPKKHQFQPAGSLILPPSSANYRAPSPATSRSIHSLVSAAFESSRSAVPSATPPPFPISLDNIEHDDVEIIELDDVEIQVTSDQSWPTVSFSESIFGPYLTVTTMRPDGHCGFRAIAHAILKCQDDWNDIRTLSSTT